MAIKLKIEPISQWVELTVRNDLSPEARGKAVASIARAGLAEAQARNRQVLGRVPPHETFVDGREGAALESVQRRIVFEFELIADVLLWIGRTLVERSPRGPAGGAGTYREAHTLFADGVEVPIGAVAPPAQEYAFTNPLPYARKLEIGTTQSGRDFLVSVPNRIYQRTAKDARARFGNIARIEFTFRALIGGNQVRQYKAAARGRAATGAFEKTLRPTAHNRADLRFPTIVVRPN